MSECKVNSKFLLDTYFQRLADEVAKKETHLDVLVNNSGVVWGEEYETYPESAFDKLYALNVKVCCILSYLNVRLCSF